MVIQALLKRNTYYDSIALMSVVQHVKDRGEVDDAGAVMATEANLALLEEAGLLPIAFLFEQGKKTWARGLLLAISAQKEASAPAAPPLSEQKTAGPGNPGN